MARTLTDEDIDAIAHRVVALTAKRLIQTTPTVVQSQQLPATIPKVTKLAYTKKELG